MRLFRSLFRPRLVGSIIALLFGFQAIVALPLHNFHHSDDPRLTAAKANTDPVSKQHGGEERCQFFQAFCSVESVSIASPGLLGLIETAFSVVAAYSSYRYSHPHFISQGRGPPRFVV